MFSLCLDLHHIPDPVQDKAPITAPDTEQGPVNDTNTLAIKEIANEAFDRSPRKTQKCYLLDTNFT